MQKTSIAPLKCWSKTRSRYFKLYIFYHIFGVLPPAYIYLKCTVVVFGVLKPPTGVPNNTANNKTTKLHCISDSIIFCSFYTLEIKRKEEKQYSKSTRSSQVSSMCAFKNRFSTVSSTQHGGTSTKINWTYSAVVEYRRGKKKACGTPAGIIVSSSVAVQVQHCKKNKKNTGAWWIYGVFQV